MSEEYLIRNCAPTLAGLKTANLFTCPADDKAAVLAEIRRISRILFPKGLRLVPLRFSDEKALIYLYRPRKLSADISNEAAAAILHRRGYDTACPDRCVAQLMQRIRAQGAFPHEIGLFLGYPPEDVLGFIENGGKCCKCVGCWKVYGDEIAAKKRFALYKKCTRVYCDRWANKNDIERLTVAG